MFDLKSIQSNLTYKESFAIKAVPKTRINWPRKVRESILDSDSLSQGVMGWAYRVPGGQDAGLRGQRVNLQGPRMSGVGPQGPRGSIGRPSGSQAVKG